MTHLWLTYDSPRTHPWLPMSYLWLTYDSPMTNPRFTYDSPMTHLWLTHDSPMTHLWLTYDSPMTYPWLTYVSSHPGTVLVLSGWDTRPRWPCTIAAVRWVAVGLLQTTLCLSVLGKTWICEMCLFQEPVPREKRYVFSLMYVADYLTNWL